MSFKKRFLALTLAAMMAVVLLASCTGGTVSSGSTATSGSAAASSSQPAASGSNILKMGISSVAGVFNPVMADTVYDAWVVDLLFDYMVVNDAEGVYVPGIATWEISEDHLTYTFTLKDGITFTDGTPMTSADVEFTYVTMAHPDYDGPRDYAVNKLVGYDEYHGGEADTFEGIKVIDDKTISFTFQEGEESAANIESFIYGIMPKHYYEFTDWQEFIALNDQPLGSGKFVFDSWALNEQVTLNTNKDYWDTENVPSIDGILMLNVPEENMLGALQTGEVDFGQVTATKDNLAEMQTLTDVIQTVNFVGNGYTYMAFNCTLPKLSDVRVRQALMYSLDRKAFIDAYYGAELGSVGMAPISPVSWAFPDSESLNPYDYDLDKAGELLDEAGWTMSDDGYRYKDGEKLSISWLVYEDSPWPAVLAGMAFDSWKQVGIELIIEKMDFNAVRARAQIPPPEEKDFEIYTMGFSLSIDPNPEGALFDADAYTAGGFNATGFRDERSQELIILGKNEFDQEKRAEIYKEWATLQNELIPTVIVAYRNELWGVGTRVSGMQIDSYVMWTYNIQDVTLS